MPQFAQFDPTAAAPAPVLGWYDTDLLNYPNLPAADDLVKLTAVEWADRIDNPSAWAVSAGKLVAYVPPAPVLTLAQQAAAALGAGLAIVSTGTAALSGTYACDGQHQGRLDRISTYIETNAKFPAGLAAMPWPDLDGVVHSFPTVASFQAFASAVANYVVELDAVIMGVATALPAASATIP